MRSERWPQLLSIVQEQGGEGEQRRGAGRGAAAVSSSERHGNAAPTQQQHPRFRASEAVWRTGGPGLPGGANRARPVQVPAMIMKSIRKIEKSTSAIVRVMSQWRGIGRASIRSAKPLSISEAGSVASAMARATRARTFPDRRSHRKQCR